MNSEPISEFIDSGNQKKDHGVPLDHLDFKYIEKCENVKELEKIYKVLL
jgi:hypothetical protein